MRKFSKKKSTVDVEAGDEESQRLLHPASQGKPMEIMRTSVVDAVYDEDEGDDVFLWHCRKIQKQVYYRINMYHLAARWCTKQDTYKFHQPILMATSLTAILAFVGTALPKYEHRAMVSVLSGGLGVLASILASYRNAYKFDLKAALFLDAERKYLALADQTQQWRADYQAKPVNERNGIDEWDKLVSTFEGRCK